MAETHTFPIDIDPAAQEQLFTEARTTYNWQPTEVPDEVIDAAYDLAKMGPTAMNCSPLRFKVVRSAAAKAKLAAAGGEINQPKIEAAPLTLILAQSNGFYKHMPELFPHYPGVDQMYANNPELAASAAHDNALLQAGYLILALRAVGLGVGPMNGADFSQIATDFYEGTDCTPFLILNVGFPAEPANDFPRNPRLTYAQVAETI